MIVGYLKHLRELYGYVYPGLIPFLLMLLLVLIMLVAYAGYRHFLA